MSEISAALVKSLRERTGAGMMDCKRALTETRGELEAAIDWLRSHGLSAAAKKSGRVTADGLIGVCVDGHRGALVEVNSETDFVARNEVFQGFVRTVARLALDAEGDVQKLLAMPYPGDGIPVAEKLTRLIATIGENMNLRRCALLTVEDGVIGAYVHAAQADGLGRIGVLTALAGAPGNERVQEFGKKLAMHTAAASPLAVERDSVDPAVVERERRIILEQAQATGKAPQFLEKMVDGRMNKFYQDVCLLEQVYVLDGERRVRAVLEELARDAGAPVRVTGFVRFALGEGVGKAQAA